MDQFEKALPFSGFVRERQPQIAQTRTGRGAAWRQVDHGPRIHLPEVENYACAVIDNRADSLDNSPMPGRFDGILLDFYGTVAAGDRQAVEDTCASVIRACGLDFDPARFAILWGQRYFELVGESNHESFRALIECETISLRETLAGMQQVVNVSPFIEQLEAYWRDPPIHDDVTDFLERVNLPVCVVSNADTHALMQAIGKHGLRFEGVLTSEMVRAYKPDPKIFEHALALIGVDAHRAMHVGDSLHSDVAGASSAGITATWLCREDRIYDVGSHGADHTVNSLRQVLELL